MFNTVRGMEGDKLRGIREQLELTQAQLAAELGVRPNTVARYERGILAIPRVVELAIEALVVRFRARKAQTLSSNKSSKKGDTAK